MTQRANAADAVELHALQRLAFRSEAEELGDWTIQPLVDPLEETVEALERQTVLKAVTAAGRIVGAVRGRVEGDTARIGRLAVHPDYRGRGLGRRLLGEIEAAMPAGVRRFALFTSAVSERNLHLYTSSGYAEERRERVSARLTLVHLVKPRP